MQDNDQIQKNLCRQWYQSQKSRRSSWNNKCIYFFGLLYKSMWWLIIFTKFSFHYGMNVSPPKIHMLGTSLVAQWLRIRLPMQGTRVRALVREDPTCRGATKPMRHNYWACTLEPMSHSYWARVPQLLKPVPRARALQQEKPLKWEAHAPQQRVAPALRN